jgi:hypothetical protein
MGDLPPLSGSFAAFTEETSTLRLTRVTCQVVCSTRPWSIRKLRSLCCPNSKWSWESTQLTRWRKCLRIWLCPKPCTKNFPRMRITQFKELNWLPSRFLRMETGQSMSKLRAIFLALWLWSVKSSKDTTTTNLITESWGGWTNLEPWTCNRPSLSEATSCSVMYFRPQSFHFSMKRSRGPMESWRSALKSRRKI